MRFGVRFSGPKQRGKEEKKKFKEKTTHSPVIVREGGRWSTCCVFFLARSREPSAPKEEVPRWHKGLPSCQSTRWILALPDLAEHFLPLVLSPTPPADSAVPWLVPTSVLSAVHLQVGQLEVSLVAARVGTHEGTLLVGLARRPHDGRSHPGHTPHVLQGQTPAQATSVCSALPSHFQVAQHLPRTKRYSVHAGNRKFCCVLRQRPQYALIGSLQSVKVIRRGSTVNSA